MNNGEYKGEYQEGYNENSEGKKSISVVKGGIAIALIIFALMVGMLTIRGIFSSDEKETEASSENQNEVVLESESKESQNLTENTENSNVVAEQETDINVTEPQSSNESSDLGNSLFKVDEPVLSESYETSVIVAGKEVYVVNDNQYAYALSLIVPDDGGYEIIKYFCPKKTYDGVSNNETVKAVYQLDEKGIISITSISK